MTEGGDVSIPDLVDMPEACALEMKQTSKDTTHTLLNPSPVIGIRAILRCQNFSYLSKLFRVKTYVVKFVRLLVKRLNKGDGGR